jgi:hypothetical protein
MQFDGQLHRLKLRREKQTHKRKNKWVIGDKWIQTWSDESIRVEVEYQITGFDEESHAFKGKVTVVRHGQSRSFPLWGASGC